MAQDSSQERTEAPSQRRRDEARKKGQVPRSTDASNAISLLGTALALWLSAPLLGSYLIQIVRTELTTFHRTELSIPQACNYFFNAVHGVLLAVTPMLAIAGTAAACGAVAQSGLSVSFESLAIDWSKLSITKGWQKLFSMAAFVRGAVFGLKLTGLVLVATGLTLAGFEQWAAISKMGLVMTIVGIWDVIVMITFVFAGLLLSIGAIDYAYQWLRNENELKMTLQQLRDESKDQEGDPQLKQKLRAMQREVVKLQMLREVPSATVILTNPTHFAVAIRYERTEMATPIVVAKGTDAFARRITKIAREHGIPVLERKPLARALYASVEVNQEIPVTLYKAIAEILAYVYGLKRAA